MKLNKFETTRFSATLASNTRRAASVFAVTFAKKELLHYRDITTVVMKKNDANDALTEHGIWC